MNFSAKAAAWAEPGPHWRLWPVGQILQSPSRLRPGQSRGFWAKPGPNNTSEIIVGFIKVMDIRLFSVVAVA